MTEIEWRHSEGLTDYQAALTEMEARVEAIRNGDAPELLWFLEHPPLYTAGTSARTQDLIAPERFPVFNAGRGGQFTYHGPGQRIVYTLLDLKKRGTDIRCFVHRLEDWIIAALARFSVKGERRDDRVGVWVVRGPGREDKIAALGIRVRKWVSFHGIAINVEPELEHYSGIVPCGIAEHGVTSLVDLGLPVTMSDLDAALIETFDEVFGANGACNA